MSIRQPLCTKLPSIAENGIVDHRVATDLVVAIASGEKERVAASIAKNPDVNHQDKYGLAPIHYAGCAGRKDLVEMLFKAGAKLDIQDNNGCNVLMYAVGCSPLHTNIQDN